jgi:hypothetical protein
MYKYCDKNHFKINTKGTLCIPSVELKGREPLICIYVCIYVCILLYIHVINEDICINIYIHDI